VDPLVRKEYNQMLLLHFEMVNDLASALRTAMASATSRPSIVFAMATNWKREIVAMINIDKLH
jgi:hypothetical protein